MILLANYFALGSMAGGVVVALFSCFLIRDAAAWFPLVCAGYSVLGCLSAAIYAPLVKVAGFRRRPVTSNDGRRAFIIAAVCSVGQYLAAVALRSHEYDRVMLFTVPFCAALASVRLSRASAEPRQSG